jgi:ferrous iron transport protein B
VKIALFGNPNTGKSSVFNLLTGLRQQVGNFAGVTVDKKFGNFKIGQTEHRIIDFPGTYSIYPRTEDEGVVYSVLTDRNHDDFPELALVVLDSSQLKRNLLLCSQLYDLQIPLILVVNMGDIAKQRGITIEMDALAAIFPGTKVVSTNARIGLGKDRLMDAISNFDYPNTIDLSKYKPASIENTQDQIEETKKRATWIDSILPQIQAQTLQQKPERHFLDKILVHWFWGYLIFASILLVVFQFIFAFATYPMNAIDLFFSALSDLTQENLPHGIFTDLLSQGILPGLGGIVIFVPQIALLFFFISILEETGYLSRVVFIMDRLMRPFGLNGKSVVPLMSSVACAIPGIMSARTISDWRERLITILVAPLMSCSARIPVYTLLIALVIPNESIGGILNLRGLVLFGLYALGLVSALLVAILLKGFIKRKGSGFLLLELPTFKKPRIQNVLITVFEKVRVFVWDAGKVILAISILLWVFATFGPGDSLSNAERIATMEAVEKQLTKNEQAQYVASARLEHSYMGILGKTIEPFIQPIGYDWKIGVSLLTSFAAREVFVGSLATIYAVQDDGDENQLLIDRLRKDVRKDGSKTYTLATGCSLMVFYVFAMQCMSTLAVVKRETGSWKWPIFQLVFMGILAYSAAFFTFSILS